MKQKENDRLVRSGIWGFLRFILIESDACYNPIHFEIETETLLRGSRADSERSHLWREYNLTYKAFVFETEPFTARNAMKPPC